MWSSVFTRNGIKMNFKYIYAVLFFSFCRFEGCIKTPKYSVGVKRFRRARLLKSERTLPGCRNACKDKSIAGKCYNGGKCVNKVVRRECDCKGTGYYGSNCSQGRNYRDFFPLWFSKFRQDKLKVYKSPTTCGYITYSYYFRERGKNWMHK